MMKTTSTVVLSRPWPPSPPPPWRMTGGSDGEEAVGPIRRRELTAAGRRTRQRPKSPNPGQNSGKTTPLDSRVPTTASRFHRQRSGSTPPIKRHVSINQRCLEPRELRALLR
jgi:hypothetical protein